MTQINVFKTYKRFQDLTFVMKKYFLVYDDEGNEIGLRFLIVSDWGGKSVPPFTTQVQKSIGWSMAGTADKYDCSFVISLGDNFREAGVTSADDIRFKVNAINHLVALCSFPFTTKGLV